MTASDTTCQIRPARAEDRDHILELWQTLLSEQENLEPRFQVAEDAAVRWRNDYEEWLRDEERRIFVAEVKDEPAGFISACRWFTPPVYRAVREVYIEEIYVAPEARRQGIGRKLVASVRAWADDQKVERLRAGVLAQNKEARAFWEDLEARPLSVTFTIEMRQSPAETGEKTTRSIGF